MPGQKHLQRVDAIIQMLSMTPESILTTADCRHNERVPAGRQSSVRSIAGVGEKSVGGRANGWNAEVSGLSATRQIRASKSPLR